MTLKRRSLSCCSCWRRSRLQAVSASVRAAELVSYIAPSGSTPKNTTRGRAAEESMCVSLLLLEPFYHILQIHQAQKCAHGDDAPDPKVNVEENKAGVGHGSDGPAVPFLLADHVGAQHGQRPASPIEVVRYHLASSRYFATRQIQV